ncbi:hypothetical protein [[Eubacterium] cellulosolvens]
MSQKNFPLGFSVILLCIGSICIIIARTPIEVFLCAELVTISAFYIFFTIIIPALHPMKIDPEKIFIGGVAKPPYISSSELLSPDIPLISEEYNDSWEHYYDKNKIRKNNGENKT